jgi:hypothetical protein
MPNYYKIDNVFKAHFTLRVKAKVEVKLNIPIDAIIDLAPRVLY